MIILILDKRDKGGGSCDGEDALTHPSTSSQHR